MSRNFPHLDDTAFPNVANVDPYKYENTFDYSTWGPDTKLTLCTVPWCGDYSDVVKFDDDTARDKWFDALAGYTQVLTTMIHVKPEGRVKLPYPVSVAVRYNYLVVDLPTPPVEHGDMSRRSRYFYFLDDCIQLSPNATDCAITLDVWTTYINSMQIDYLMLSRGHAPVAATSVDSYLANPRENATYLLAPDYSQGELAKAASHKEKVWNAGDMYFCLITRASFYDSADWGSASAPLSPGIAGLAQQGQAGAPDVWAVDASDWSALLTAINVNAPWKLECVEGCFFIAKDLVSVASTATINGVSAYRLTATRKTVDLMQLTKSSFDYPAEAAGYAKLYTYPYAAIEITDEDGNVTQIRVEDTDGTITLGYGLSLAYPYIAIDANLIDYCGVSADTTFKNANSHTFGIGGRWYATLKSWNVAIFSLSQSALVNATYSTQYDRAHQLLAATNANASTLASNSTAYTNAANSAANVTANNATTVALNSTITSTQNSYALSGNSASADYNSNTTELDVGVSSASYLADMAGLAVAASNNAVNGAVGVGSALLSAGISAVTGNVAGAASSIGSAINAGISWSTASASNAISQSNSESVYAATISATRAKGSQSNSYGTEATTIQNNTRTSCTNSSNSASNTIASRNASLITTNAGNSKTTADANAARTLATAKDAISAGLASAGVAAPVTFGATSATEHATTRPQGAFASVVTQRTGDIMSAASQFARYGYTLNQQWKLTKWQVMKYFTYWQSEDCWCAGTADTIESAQLTVQNILKAGVTVWSDPEKIGKVNIYDN